ncbi:Glutathione S-transferase, partial [Oryctes borbonicus]
MAAGTLYTYPENFRAYKALIAAQYASLNVKVDPTFKFGETNKSEEFLKKFPTGKVPAFETVDGKYLSGGNAIAYYLANDQLRGTTLIDQAQVIQWISYAENEILPPACAWVFPILGIMPYNKQSFERAKEDMKVILNILNTHLLTRTFMVGERITLADITIACTLLHCYTTVFDPEYRKSFANVNRWFLTVVNQPQVKGVVSDVKLCEGVPEVDHKKYAQFQASQGKDTGKQKKEKKEDKKEEKKEKKQPAPKAQAPEEELDAADEALAAEPKNKDPFDGLPKGNFNMDDFKRCYSNEDETKSIPYFWEKFDADNYSIWYGEYKYPEELSKVFMSCNLITGMFQRLDKMRKQAFASVCLYGADNDSSISGVWVWRGQDLAFTLSSDWQIDYEVYEWKKLDPTSPETKALVQQYFSWTG